MTISLIIALSIYLLLGIIFTFLGTKIKKDILKVYGNLSNKVGTLMYIVPGLLNLYSEKIENFSQVNSILMNTQNNFLKSNHGLKAITQFVDQSKADVEYISNMVGKIPQTNQFSNFQESINFLQDYMPKYSNIRLLGKIFTFGLYKNLENKLTGKNTKIEP